VAASVKSDTFKTLPIIPEENIKIKNKNNGVLFVFFMYLSIHKLQRIEVKDIALFVKD